MKPIYFPFTYISDSVAEAVAACFGQFIVYRPTKDKVPEHMQQWVQQGVLELRVPATENGKALATAVKNYLNWANMHLGDSTGRAVDLKSRLGASPFFDDSSSSKILEDVKKKMRGGAAGKTADPTFTARIFLCLAQELDRQNQEAAHELYRYHQKNADLMRQLKMEDDSLADELRSVVLPDRVGDYMVSDRLEAWTRIFLRDTGESGLFVTHSAAVMAHLLERSPTAAKVMHLESIPLDIAKTSAGESWKQQLALDLARWAENDQESAAAVLNEGFGFPSAARNFSLNVYRVSHQNPMEFFVRCAELNDTAVSVQQVKLKNTVIAFIGGLETSATII